ncbi:hypothetical protein [Phaffia rhodozyma]|uniref:Zinc finger, CCHC-type n=1 Tax=Phaffia rhodozyma TaxID=264483 RepID=A0A0F7SP32_PHARH|nr:hypothetical protein [Phaffia rhodozyma]
MPRQPTSYSRPFVPASCGFVARPVDDGPSSMDIDVVETPAAKQNTYGRAPTFHPVSRTAAGVSRPNIIKVPLSAAEKQRRRRENLCLYCGDATHHRNACPLLRQNDQPSQMAELTIYLDTDEMDEDSEKVRTQ